MLLNKRILKLQKQCIKKNLLLLKLNLFADMDLYSKKSKSIPQKTTIVVLEILMMYFSYWILFKNGGSIMLNKIGINESMGDLTIRILIFIFSIIVFIRMTFMIFYLLKRRIPWEESISVPFAFALYYIGFALLGYRRVLSLDWIDFFAIGLFIIGSGINTISELQRHFWKNRPENKGKLFTNGLFRYSMHINYFGDLLWVTAYAIITRNVYSIAIPVFLFCFFAFYNIPMLDAHLREKYGVQFENYRRTTKRFIPFVY